jgi:nucleoside phosphorylase
MKGTDEVEPPETLKRLANILEIRQQASRPYNLLLTSSLSLTPTLLQTICHCDNWAVFRHYMDNLGSNDRLHALNPLLETPQHLDGYRALARLITRRYFSTVLTTNIDSTLEDVLREVGLRPQTLVLDRDTDEYILQALDGYTDNIRIVKLHGSLRDRVLPATFPDFCELHPTIIESVKRYLNQDLIIVGSLEHEDDMNRALTRSGKSSIYNVLADLPTPNDNVVKLIQARGNPPEAYVIAGEYGGFDLFFTTLEALLLSKITASSAQSQTLSPPTKQSSTRGHAFTNSIAMPLQEAPRADVLLVTVTEVETRAVFDVIKKKHGVGHARHFLGNKTYYNLGVINEARVFLVQSEMGTSRLGGSLQTVSAGIQALKPSAVVMVGIAFGFDSKKQRIGDILVSQKLRGYELQRYGSGPDGAPVPVLRGELVSASVRLLDRFRSGYRDWPGPARVEFGLLLSGEKLVDNRDFRDQLRAFEPEAIGGDMEGAGLYAAAHLDKIDWIVVKAICDWADGDKSHNKSQYQKKAARNAALFTMHVLQQTRLVDSS